MQECPLLFRVCTPSSPPPYNESLGKTNSIWKPSSTFLFLAQIPHVLLSHKYFFAGISTFLASPSFQALLSMLFRCLEFFSLSIFPSFKFYCSFTSHCIHCLYFPPCSSHIFPLQVFEENALIGDITTKQMILVLKNR